MRIVFLFLLVGFPAVAFCGGCEESRKKRDLLIRTKRRWVLSTIEIEEEMKVDYPHFVSKMYNDKIQGKEFRFEISGEAVELNYLTINEKTGEVFVHKPIDREKYPCFHIIFDVYDTMTDLKIDKELAFDVEVKDINDNPPRFIKIPNHAYVNESQPQGLLGIELIAQDMDEKGSKNSTFNITVVKQDPLEPKINAKWIDERIVHLNFTGCFNYEKAKQYKITVEAKDHGTPPMSSSAVIILNVRDTNTNMPVFKKREFQAEVHEMDLKPNLFRFPVEDKDTPNTDGWRAKFFIISDNKEGIFKVETDPKTNEGIFSIVKKKNYDNTTMVEVQIGVENIEPFTKCENGELITQENKLFPPDSIVVKITMLDDNDPPVFQPPSVAVYENEESEPGRVFCTPKVFDPDSTSFRFALVDDPADWVSIDEITGEIRATKKMDRESPFVNDDNVYRVLIAAIDNGIPPATSYCNISIHLKDINDNTPQLVNASLIMCGNKMSLAPRQHGSECSCTSKTLFTPKKVNVVKKQFLIMPPKNPPVTDDSEDIKKLLDFVLEEIRALKTQYQEIVDRLEDGRQLRALHDRTVNRINNLDKRIDDLQQNARINDVIITGLKIKPQLYTHAAAAGNGEASQEMRSVEQQVEDFLKSKGISLDTNNLEVCRPLPKKRETDRPAILMRFVNRKHKVALLKQRRNLKGSNVFIKENLSKRNADIARRSRYLKKIGKFQNTWTRDGKIYAKLCGSPEQAKVFVIRSLEELEKFGPTSVQTRDK